MKGGIPTPSKLTSITALSNDTLSRATDGYEPWTALLRTMSRNYKYSFADQILIHAQRPDTSACAEYDVWTERMRRYVRRGVKGIALVDNSGDAPRLRYVFDVSDTGAKRNSRPFRPWTINDGNLGEVQLGLRQDFGAEGEWLSSQLQDAARDLAEMYYNAHRHDIGDIVDGSLMAGYDESELRDSFIRAASVSTAYALISRCGYDPEAYFASEDFAFLNEWNTPDAVTALGTAVSENTQLVLREIERTIRSYERSLQNDRDNLQYRERRTASEPEPARDEANRPVREAAPEVSAGAPSGAVEPARADGDAVRAPERDRDGGESADGANSAKAGSGGGRDGGAEIQRPDEVDGPHEHLQGSGRRSSSERVNIQLNLFDEAEDADAPSAFVCPQEVIDAVLRVGENTSHLRERVVAEYEKQRPLDEIAAFLPTVYHGGVGVTVDGEQYAAWMDVDGIRIARGDEARYVGDAQLVTWNDAAERISELLDAGQYAGSWEIERAAATDRQLLAEQLWYLRHDLADERRGDFFPSLAGITSTTFPEETEHVAAMLADREQCEKVLAEYRDFLAAYKADPSVLRFHYHKTDEILASLESQLLPRVQFHANAELLPSAPQFITQDEIDELLCSGGSIAGGKWRIFQYFTEEHSLNEKVSALKGLYGTGGHTPALSGTPGSNENHDAKGIRLSKGGCEYVTLSWRQVARRIDTLIETDRYMTSDELTVYDTSHRYNDFKYRHHDDILLIEQGGTLYTFGPDVDTVSSALAVRIRHDHCVDFVSIPAGSFDDAMTDKLRERRAVTIIHEDGSEQTLPVAVPDEGHEKYEERQVGAEPLEAPKESAPAEDEPELDDAPVNIQPRDPMASAYGVGDFVWYEGREYQITDIQRSYVEFLATGLAIPVYRIESRADFESGIRADERNRYITDYLSAVLDLTDSDLQGALVDDGGILSHEDKSRISAHLRAGEGNSQIAGLLGSLAAGRAARMTLATGDSAEYSTSEAGAEVRVLDDDGNVLAALRPTWAEIAPILRAMYQQERDGFEHGASAAIIEQSEDVDKAAPKFHERTVAYYDAEKTHLPYDVVFQTIGSAPEPESTPPEPEPTLHETPHNFRITDDHLGEGGAKARFRANMDAIHLLKQLESDGRAATTDEQETLSRYTGWGAIPDAFDEDKSDWVKEYAELKAALTPEEYEAARGSTLNAHYTSPTVIRAIYETLGNMGFEGGRILEPSCGVGNFFGLLPDSMSTSQLYGVELDSITGRIAKQLYPEAEIAVAGFETTNRPGFFDLAIGNVPFGNYQVFDPKYNRLGFSIHNYFAAKMLDQVRPGGIAAFVTSRYTMDAKDESVRRYLAARGELLGAIRLPNNAFRANAGTDVVTDIIFLQRRGLPLTELPDWVHVGENEDGFKVNNYFLQHPEMVLGTPTAESTQYGRQDYTVAPIEGADLAEQLHEAIQHIHGEYGERDIEENTVSDILPADPGVRNYSFTLVNGDIFYREGGIMARQDVSAATAERIKGLMDLRDCTRRLIELQTMDAGDAVIVAEQKRLNELYDAFIAKHGLISSRENKRAFEDDSSYYLLCSLEILDDDGKLERKSDMFTKRTIKPHIPVEHTDTAVEALAVSMNEKARVDLPYMAQLCGKGEDEVISELQGVIFRVPGTDRYVTADEYLSGNVRQKLREAEAAAEGDAAFNINVEALRAAQPRDLTASEIDVRLGATWIEPKYIRQFINETFKPAFWASQSVKVHYSPVTGEWRVEGKSAVGANDVNAYSTYGTQRMNAYKILENTLNLRDVRIYDKVEDENGNERRVLNTKETTLAQQKQQVIKDAFKDWLWKDAERRQTLVAKYNELFNSIKPREYDGSHLTFPGMNPEINLRKHQRDAIARILYGGNTLLAHEVGAGKTFTMAAAAMETKRLGLCSKPMFVVPNHLTGQWASEFLRLYPSANILVTTKKDFEKANRKKFCARIATGDYDAVIIGHSQFEKIPVSQERQEQLLQDQIDELAEGIRELKSANGERFSIKAMERTKKGLEAKLKKLLDSPKDDVVTFEELGVDRLFVDEAHSYKNLYYQTKMQNVAGLSSAEAQKSSDMYMKCRYLDEKTCSKGVVFATGTPVSNTMVELYTMQRYLQHDALDKLGMNHFDSWAGNFGETVTAMELAPEGTGYRARTRFSKFFNLPELMSLFREAADIKTADELNLPRPKVVYHNEVSQPTEIQKQMVKALSERATKVHNRLVDPSEDNMLAITNDGRKLGLDQRVVNPLLPDEPGTKVNKCVDNVFKIWEDGADEKLTQLIFCDLSTPGKGFSVYDDIKKKLVARGVPEEEIAFIHDANTDEKKKALFAKVRSGQVRVLMGSTAKMGAGTNVQDRLIALHDLDAPWRPGDLEQRKGRIARQGNMNETVHIYRYVTENSFDAYLWQTLENKQKFISQIMTSKNPVRSCEDVDETTLSFAEIKALCAGDPRIKEQMNLVVEVSKLRMLKSSFQSQKYDLEYGLMRYFPREITETKARIAALESDIQTRDAHPGPSDGFAGIELRGRQFTERVAAGEALLKLLPTVQDTKPVHVGSFRGFEVEVSLEEFGKHVLTLKGASEHHVELGEDALGNIMRVENALVGLDKQLEKARGHLAGLEQQAENARAELEKPFPQEGELAEKSARLIELNAELDMENKTLPESVSEDKEDERPSLLAKLKEPIPLYEPKPQHQVKEACL